MAKYILLTILIFISTSSKLPGTLISLTPNLVNSYLQGFLSQLEKDLQEMQLPQTAFPILSTNTVEIKDFSMDSIKLLNENTGLNFKASREMVLTIPNVEFKSKFSWAVLSNNKAELQHGDASFIVNDATVTIILYLNDDLAQPVKLSRCEFEMNTFKIVFDNTSAKGELNWVLDSMNRKMKKTVINEVLKSLNSKISAMIQKIPDLSQDLWLDLNNWLMFNMKFYSVPDIDDSHIELKIDGTFLKPGEEYEIELPPPTELVNSSQKTLAVYVSEFTFNSFFLAKYQADPLKFSNKDFGVEITTNTVEPIIPGITEELGRNQPAEIICKQNRFAPFALNPKKLSNSLSLACDLNINKKTVIKVEAEVLSETSISIGSGILFGSINKLQVIKLEKLENSLETEFDIQNFKDFLKGTLLIARGIISNKIFGTGISLPTTLDAYFKELKMTLQSGHLLIEGTPQYPIK